MVEIFRSAELKLLDELFDAINSWKSYWYLKARLEWITSELNKRYSQYANISTRERYIDGMTYYDKEAKEYVRDYTKLSLIDRTSKSNKVVVAIWWVNPVVVENLIVQGENYVWQALNNTLKGILWTFSEIKIQEAFATIWEWETLWQSIFQTREDLVKQFWNIWLTDKAGRKWTLERYSEMLVRTETAKAKNLATLTRGKELWITKYKRNEKGDACPICVPHRGEVVEVKDTMPYLLLHPNCRWFREPIFE